MKRKLHAEAAEILPAMKKQLRSKLPRRKRSHISPILRSFSIPDASSNLTSEVSRESSVHKETVVVVKKKREIEVDEFRRITRAYLKKKDAEVELSECSCVDSCSEIVGKIVKIEDPVDISHDIVSKQKRNAKVVEGTEDSDAISCSEIIGKIIKVEDPVEQRNVKVSARTEDSDAISRFLKNSGGFYGESSKSGVDVVEGNRNTEDSDAISRFLKNASGFFGESSKSGVDVSVEGTRYTEKINDEDVVSFNSVLQSPSESKCGNLSVQTIKCTENRAAEEDIESEVSRIYPEVELSALENANEKLVEPEFDLECSENFSVLDVTADYSSAYSELQSEIFPESSDFDLSDYSPSYWYDSGSQFSEKSNGDATPSPTLTLFLRFSQQFCRSTAALQFTSVNSSEDHISTEITGLEDEEDEESYMLIRNRERRQLYLHDYAEEYCSTTDSGDLIVQQRLLMVHWILEQATRKDLLKETMFLSVNLFDRFLSKGYFKTKRCLQIVGIACLTLAVRIEENQPFNSIRQKTFTVAGTAYSCSEVVAMEWLVQEVLNFQCFLPTIYNFLWFYLKAARATEYMERTTKYLAVLALLGHEHLCYRPSTVASALVILALSAANLYVSCHLVTKTHAKIKDEDLPECIKVNSHSPSFIPKSLPYNQLSYKDRAQSELAIQAIVLIIAAIFSSKIIQLGTKINHTKKLLTFLNFSSWIGANFQAIVSQLCCCPQILLAGISAKVPQEWNSMICLCWDIYNLTRNFPLTGSKT
ncbi:Cyclin-SDS [Capsicum chinense]|nr:Cyclin-SDS [Capsicum chinense]